MKRWMLDRGSDGDAVHPWERACCEASSTRCVPVAVVDFGKQSDVARLRLACPDSWCFDEDDETRVEVNAYLAAALREFASPKSCDAVLYVGSERIECERDSPGHLTDHRNDSIGQGVRWSA